MFENESNIAIFKAMELSCNQVVEIVGQEEQGLFVSFYTSGETVTLQSVQNIGFTFPQWERMGEYKTISVYTFLRRVHLLEPEEE